MADVGPTARSMLRNPRARAFFENGLRATFPACHEPMPPEMAELVQRLHEKLQAPKED
jgi:hypothetical protein